MNEQQSFRFQTIPLLDSKEGKDIVRKICSDSGIPEPVFAELVKAELQQVGRIRKRGLDHLFSSAFAQMDREHVDS